MNSVSQKGLGERSARQMRQEAAAAIPEEVSDAMYDYEKALQEDFEAGSHDPMWRGASRVIEARETFLLRLRYMDSLGSPPPMTAHREPKMTPVTRPPQQSPHTPTPWKVGGGQWSGTPRIEPNVISLGDNGGCDDPDCCGGASYHVELSDDDAAFIVRAVNAHAELVAALEQAETFLAELNDDADMVASVKVRDQIRAALRLAEEGHQ